jgi:peptidoglycan hydrolase-like protein with peptidoglycan-binding domain
MRRRIEERAMTFQLIWLPGVLRNAGLKVAEVPGWADRGHGDVGSVAGVVCHHTGTPGALDKNMPTLDVLINGRSDLSGPLSQLGLGRDGTYYVVAAGRCYHAGAGQWKGISGNSRFIGIEGENGGSRTDAWPPEQMDAYRRGVAAILKQIGADVSMCCGHREYAPHRKDDPLFDMDQFRADVQAILRGAGTVRPLIPATIAADKPTLKRGSRGDAVKTVQAKVGVAPDGIYGPGTEAAVRAFQRSRNEVPDGIVGPKTWALINA